MNQEQQFSITRQISLPNGGVMEISLTEEFLDRVRYQFSLTPKSYVEDDYIRMFIYGAVNSSINKAEEEMKDG